MVAAGEKEQAGDIDGAMGIWAQLLDSLRTHNDEACGNYARKLGQALDDRGRLTEALAAYDAEIDCWSRLTDDPAYAEGMLPHKRRAEQLRPEIRAFVARPAAMAPRTKLAKNEPALGTMLGATLDLDPAIGGNPAKVAGVYGKPDAMALTYPAWGQMTRLVTNTMIWEQAPALQVALQPEQGLNAVQDGAYLRNFARELKSFGRPVYLRFGGEMNGSWTQWYGDPALYKAKFALVARVMREEAPNVAMVWSPNYVGDAQPDDYYPGDDVVDWVGINAYTEPYFLGNPNGATKDADIFYQGKRVNPLDKFRAIYDRYAARKPIMISETGFGWANRTPALDESQWASGAMDSFYGYLPLVFPRIKAVSYFNVNRTQLTSTSNYLLSANPLMTATYKRATAPDWYLSSPSASAATFWRPAEQATLAGPARLAAYVHLYGGVSRVAYLLDGKQVAAATQLPWTADVDFSGLTGTHTLTVVAYGADGQVGYQKEYRIDGSAIKVQLNGSYLDFDQPPVNLDGRILVPVRAILEALGAEISWDAATQTVSATRGGSVLQLQIDNPVPLKDGRPLPALTVPAKVAGGRTMVPARFVSENYDMNVTWDASTQTVVITPK
jgi:hypothetical protein